jgi:sulfur carrier protein
MTSQEEETRMRLTLNGRPTEVEEGVVLADLVAGPTGCAAAVNGEVVPRGRHTVHRLADGDVVEIVTAVQGG